MSNQIRKAELLQKGIAKHVAYNRHFGRYADYALCYPDGTEILTIPGQPDQIFQLDKYKEDLCKPYKRINLFLVDRESPEEANLLDSDPKLDAEEKQDCDGNIALCAKRCMKSAVIPPPIASPAVVELETDLVPGTSSKLTCLEKFEKLKEMFPEKGSVELMEAITIHGSVSTAAIFLSNCNEVPQSGTEETDIDAILLNPVFLLQNQKRNHYSPFCRKLQRQ